MHLYFYIIYIHINIYNSCFFYMFIKMYTTHTHILYKHSTNKILLHSNRRKLLNSSNMSSPLSCTIHSVGGPHHTVVSCWVEALFVIQNVTSCQHISEMFVSLIWIYRGVYVPTRAPVQNFNFTAVDKLLDLGDRQGDGGRMQLFAL